MMHEHALGASPLGDRSAAFRVWAPRIDRLMLRLLDPPRAINMTRSEDGYFGAEVEAPPGSLYQYCFPDGRCRPDPASRCQPQGVHGPSQVVAPSFGWSDDAWRNPPLESQVLYEIHVGTFTPEGTFDAIIPRLPALRDLGITALELMPIAAFPGTRNWGYDGVLPYAAQGSYGGIEGLRRLVDAAHRARVAVVLDVVYNHLGPEGNYLAEFGPYFTERYRTPWGAAMNFDGPDSDHVREYFIQNALYWTRDNHIDGLRLDAVHAIVDHTARTFVEELAARVHAAAGETGRRVLVIAESSDNDPRLVRPVEHGGWGLDGVWNDDYHHAIRTALTRDRRGYYKSFGDAAQVAGALRDRFVFTGQYCAFRRRRHGAPARDIPHHRMVVFTQNHDQVGNRPAGDRLQMAAGLDAARVFAGLVLLSPYVPLLFMGEEFAEPAPFQYFVSHADAQLIAAVRKGRREEFAEMHAAEDVPDPQDPATFLHSKLRWELRHDGIHRSMLAWYRRLLALRATLPPDGATTVIPVAHETAIAFGRDGPAPIVVVANLGREAAHLRLPAGPSRPIVLDSMEKSFGGSAPQARVLPSPEALSVDLSPHHLIVLSTEVSAHA